MENKIKVMRVGKKMSQEELSQKSGVSRTIISELETGRREVTTTSTLIKIATALESTVTEIFFDHGV